MRWPMPSKSIVTFGGSFLSPGLAAACVASVFFSPSFAPSPCPPVGFLFGDLLFVAFGRERGSFALLQHDDINAAGRLMWEGRHVKPARGRTGVGAGGEVKILAVLVEIGEARVAQSVGDLRR